MTADYTALGVFGEPFLALEKRLDSLEKTLTQGVMPEKMLLRVKDVASLLSVSDAVVYAWVNDGILPARELPVSGIFIATTDLRAFVESLPQRTAA